MNPAFLSTEEEGMLLVEIAAAYARWGNPLEALRQRDPPAPTLHLDA